MKITHKFYVGSKSTIESSEWTHQTFEQAVEHAKELLEENNNDTQYIVKVVGIVRRASTPIKVEKI